MITLTLFKEGVPVGRGSLNVLNLKMNLWYR